jgi:hypothetical protein
MRLIPGIALLAVLMSSLISSAAAASSAQTTDTWTILEASARAMDGAESMRFSGSIEMTVSAQGTPVQMSMPMSGAYQAPDRMTMSVQMPQAGMSMDMIMVGGQMWMRMGQGAWRAQRVPRDAAANPMGMSHADWYRDLMEISIADAGSAYRVTAAMDVAQAMNAGYSSAFSTGMSGLPIDTSAVSSQVTLTIDKTTSYIVSMQMDISMPVPDLATTMDMSMTMAFSDFNVRAAEILPPV